MRIINGTSTSPSSAQVPCLNKYRYGSRLASIATTADALYTITTLVHTRRTVAVNSNLSDLSFRAILRRLKVRPGRTDNHPDGAHQPRTARVHGPALTTRMLRARVVSRATRWSGSPRRVARRDTDLRDVTVSSQQSSAGRGLRHHPRRPGQPAFPADGSSPHQPD